jgi:hypothetical protein
MNIFEYAENAPKIGKPVHFRSIADVFQEQAKTQNPTKPPAIKAVQKPRPKSREIRRPKPIYTTMTEIRMLQGAKLKKRAWQ